jgi:hypothetical protein
MKVFFFCCLLFLWCTGVAIAQTAGDDNYLAHLEWYSKSKPSTLLYVHFDKGIYTNNENIWFTAYIIKGGDMPLPQYHTLSVVLVKDDDRTIALKGKFAMAEGLSFGNILLPDTIRPGNYHLLAYTNVLNKEGKPVDVYMQPIAIKTVANQSFDAAMQVIDSGRTTGGQLKVKVSIGMGDKAGQELPSCFVNYNLGSAIKGHVKTDKQGEAIITIPASSSVKTATLFASVKYKDEIKHLSLTMPQTGPAEMSVKFYPEGGNLVVGMLNTIGWEVKTAAGQPVQINGVLYKDGLSADTIETAAYGIGRFRFTPAQGSRYTVRLLDKEQTQNSTRYSLPAPMADLPLLTLPHAVGDDTLLVQIKITHPQKITLLVHNYQDVFLNQQLRLPVRGVHSIKLAMHDMPKGLSVATLLDSQGRPLAERLFFAHYHQPEAIQISTNKVLYGTREKVSLKLKLTQTQADQPLQGSVSVACVQSNRLVPATQQDIESYVYLNRDLGTLPFNNKGRAYSSAQFVEDVLLVKGWRRYSWKKMTQAQANDTVQKYQTAVFSGATTHFGKKLKKPSQVNILSGGLLKQIPTDSMGNFNIKAEDLISTDGKKLLIAANAVDKKAYEIAITNPYDKLNRNVADQFDDEGYQPVLNMQRSASMAVTGLEKNHLLKEVVIKAQRNSSIMPVKYLGKEIDHYICIYNIINCPNHPPGTPGTIVYFTDDNASLTGLLKYEGIGLGKEFYGSDYSQVNLSTPEYYSTVYWNHAVQLTADNEAGLSFYVSDLTGNFRIVIQGVTTNGVIYAEKDFLIKKPAR